MGGFTKMMLIGESMQVRAHSCCISFFLFVTNFSSESKQSNSEVALQQHFHKLSGGSLAVVFRCSALTPRAQIPKNHSLLQTKKMSSPQRSATLLFMGVEWLSRAQSQHICPLIDDTICGSLPVRALNFGRGGVWPRELPVHLRAARTDMFVSGESHGDSLYSSGAQ